MDGSDMLDGDESESEMYVDDEGESRESEFEVRELSEFDSYEEYMDEVIMKDPMAQTEEPSGRKWFVFRVGVYVFTIIVALIIVGAVGYALFEVVVYILEYLMRILSETEGVASFIGI